MTGRACNRRIGPSRTPTPQHVSSRPSAERTRGRDQRRRLEDALRRRHGSAGRQVEPAAGGSPGRASKRRDLDPRSRETQPQTTATSLRPARVKASLLIPKHPRRTPEATTRGPTRSVDSLLLQALADSRRWICRNLQQTCSGRSKLTTPFTTSALASRTDTASPSGRCDPWTLAETAGSGDHRGPAVTLAVNIDHGAREDLTDPVLEQQASTRSIAARSYRFARRSEVAICSGSTCRPRDHPRRHRLARTGPRRPRRRTGRPAGAAAR